MKKIIFVLEDNPSMNRHLVELLNDRPELKKYKVECRSRIDLAIEFFDDHKKEIFCIITDLNMDEEWLDEELLEETEGGMFSGWVWLQHYVYTENPNIPTIIYSGYSSDFKNYLHSKGEYHKLNKGNISIVNKGSNKGEGFKSLFLELKKILK